MKLIEKILKGKDTLKIFECKNGNLKGKVYHNGELAMDAMFYVEDGDADPYRVKEYFNFL